eukprot:gene7174-7980_t
MLFALRSSTSKRAVKNLAKDLSRLSTKNSFVFELNLLSATPACQGCRNQIQHCRGLQSGATSWRGLVSASRLDSLAKQNARYCSSKTESKIEKPPEVDSKAQKLLAHAEKIEMVIKDKIPAVPSSKSDAEESLKPYYFKPAAVDIDYNVRYTRNTFISASRAVSDYLLRLSDLDCLRKTRMRNAYSSEGYEDYCYLKLDVEERALEVWGSMEALNMEKKKRKEEMEEGERYRKGLSALLGHLKKTIKDQTKLEEDFKLFGGEKKRKLLLQGSARVVFYAVAANLLVMLFKVSAYIYTGSASMMSESIHSLADAANQCLLALGIVKSIKEPSPDHPYGWSRARYAYSLISGVGIFFLGCGFSVYHGISEIMNPSQLTSLPVAFAVLGGSMFVESLTMITAFKQVQKSAKESGLSFKEYLVRGRDPNAVAVLLEDSAAVAGLLLAAGCLGLTSYTGNTIFDAIGSISIGALLGVVAVFLIRRNTDALTGRSIHPDRLRQIIEILENDLMVRSIHDVKATEMGADTVRFKAEINFDGREVTKVHMNRLNMEDLLLEVQTIKTTEQLEHFLLDHGEQIIDVLGSQVDRIERNIKKKSPEVRHVDLEIL